MRIYEFEDQRHALRLWFDLTDNRVTFTCFTAFDDVTEDYECGPFSLDEFISAMKQLKSTGYCCIQLSGERLELRKFKTRGSLLYVRPPRSVCLLFDSWEFDPELLITLALPQFQLLKFTL